MNLNRATRVLNQGLGRSALAVLAALLMAGFAPSGSFGEDHAKSRPASAPASEIAELLRARAELARAFGLAPNSAGLMVRGRGYMTGAASSRGSATAATRGTRSASKGRSIPDATSDT